MDIPHVMAETSLVSVPSGTPRGAREAPGRSWITGSALPNSIAQPRDQRVTTTDVLKLIGVVTLLVDHYGLFYHPDENTWRLVGRAAAPIFFFLIGFARSRSVPWTWFAFGAAITFMNYLSFGSWRDATVNILFNFALLRLAILPIVERHLLSRPIPLAMLSIGCVLLIPATDEELEYSTEGWLWAFFGLAHRTALENPGTRIVWTRAGLATIAALAYIQREIHDYGFDVVQSALLLILVGTIVLSLLGFRRRALVWQPPGPLAAVLRFCGRYSLEIYGISLIAMQGHNLLVAEANEEENR
jgi:hypothetical protein